MPIKKIPQSFAILMLLFLSLSTSVYAASCTSVSATQPVFSPMTSNSSTQTVPVSIKFTCTGTVTISISSGTPYSSGDRQLFLAGIGIPYTIKKDISTDLWGDGVNLNLGTAFVVTGNGSEDSKTATFAITVPSGIPAGIYANQLDINIFDGFTALTSTTLIPTLTIVDSCTISSNPTPINFGHVPAGSSNTLTQTATIGITCGNSTPYYWGANNGNYWNGTSRQMKADSSFTYIAYSLNESGNPLGDAGLENYGGTNTTNIPSRTAIGDGIQKIYDISATITTNPLPLVADHFSDTVFYYVAW